LPCYSLVTSENHDLKRDKKPLQICNRLICKSLNGSGRYWIRTSDPPDAVCRDALNPQREAFSQVFGLYPVIRIMYSRLFFDFISLSRFTADDRDLNAST